MKDHESKACKGWDMLGFCSFRNATRQKAFFAEIRAAYRQYRIAIIHVFASWDIMQQRSSVAREGGRVTSPKALRTSFDAVTNAVAELEPLADLTLHINNDSLEPRLMYVSQAGDLSCRSGRASEKHSSRYQGPTSDCSEQSFSS
jgi:hypothetical protein